MIFGALCAYGTRMLTEPIPRVHKFMADIVGHYSYVKHIISFFRKNVNVLPPVSKKQNNFHLIPISGFRRRQFLFCVKMLLFEVSCSTLVTIRAKS